MNSENRNRNLDRNEGKMSVINIYFCHGSSLISKLIRFCTHGYWNHVAVGSNDGNIYESDWGGVICTPKEEWYKKRKNSGDKILSVSIPVPLNKKEIFEKTLKQFLNCGYDYWALVGFLFRYKPLNSPKKFFCSEYVASWLRLAGIYIYPERDEWRVTPSELFHSASSYKAGFILSETIFQSPSQF